MFQIRFLIFIVFLKFITINATKLNYPRVLLPVFDKISVNFTLEVIERGCIKWTSSRQDLILITPLYEDLDNECSYRAHVTVLSREKRRNTAIVLAEDLLTGSSLRCDIILDRIDKLSVHTTTRQLYLEEAPETFELRAEDSQGNEFTTLEGIEFNWIISSLNQPALRFLTFGESAYHAVPPELEKFESKNIKGYKVLLEGINTGTAKVTVNLPYNEYKKVPSIEVYINVLANIILEPSEAYILPGDTIKFRVLQLKLGRLQEISLRDQYFLEIEDNFIASLHMSDVKGVSIGQTTIYLRDRNAPNEGNFVGVDSVTKPAMPSARLFVVEPMKLVLSFLPHNNWVTVEGEKNAIGLDLYTSNDHRITLGDGFSIKSELDEVLFYILERSKNGSRLYGQAIKSGLTPVYGSFRELTAQAEIQIYPELSLTPTKVILPYDPNFIKIQKIQFRAKGGDNAFIWSSHNSRFLQINQNGLASTIIRSSESKLSSDTIDGGTLLSAVTSVRVSLSKNPKISRQADVFFLPPVKLEILKYNFETALKDYVRLHIAVYSYANKTFIPFTNCENLQFDYEFTNHIFQLDNSIVTEELPTGVCQIIHLRGTALGLTTLRLTYKFQDKILKDEVTLSVFEKLNILNPIENEIVLPIGSARNIIYQNGPQRIYTLDAELTTATEYDKKTFKVNEIAGQLYAYTILCLKLGTTPFNFIVYNTLAKPNFQAYKSNVTTLVHCVKPRFLYLYATEKLRSSCPLEIKNSLLHLKDRDDRFEIEIEVQDVNNRKLMNITSLFIDWKFNAGDENFASNVVEHYRRTEEELIEGIPVPGKELLITLINNVANNFRIKGIVVRYDIPVLKRYSIKAEVPHFGIQNIKSGEMITPVIENEIKFLTVNTTLFPTDHISIFMAKNRRERLPIRQGSGFYDFHLSELGTIEVEFNAKDRELILTPLRIGHTRLELVDRCLQSEPTHLSIAVVTIGSIRLGTYDRVEITQSIEAIVKLYDSYDNPLLIDSLNIQIYELTETIFNPEILSVRLDHQFDLDVGEIRFIITGKKIGETKIVFNSGTDKTLISSEPFNIQVFPPLRLYPRNTTLIVGSTVQIYYQGGPQPDVNIVYEVHDKKIISMESAIVMAEKLGKTQITGKCLITSPITGEQVVISEDTVDIHVVALSHIQIRTPLNRIRSGAVMPATIWGSSELSPMILGTLDSMTVTWSTNQPDVVEIFGIFADAGIEYGTKDLISVRIRALNPGKAKIQATVNFAGGKKETSFVEVVVFKNLELDAPKKIVMDGILLAPRSTIQLKANLDDVAYKPDSDSDGVVRVTSDGIVRSGDTLGRDLIIAKTFEQALPIGIEVKNIQYILCSLEYPTVKLKQCEEKIPRGMNFILKVTLHDNLGNEFSHSIEDGIKYELSHKDLLDIQIGNNLTISLNLPREMNNMLAVSLKDTTGVKHAEDYIKLSVTDSKHIFPTKMIFSVGDIICFDSPLSKSSQWTSTNQQIVSIDKVTGIAQVVGNRLKLGEKIVVTNGDKASGNFIKYDVEVRDADVIQLFKTFDIFSGSQYRAYLVVRNHLQVDKLTNLIGSNITTCSSSVNKIAVKILTCRLTSKQNLGQELLEHYKVMSIFDVESGRYACQIDLKSKFQDVLNIVKTNDVHFELEAQLPNGLAASMSLKFIPGIKVIPDTLYVNDYREQEITITGLDKVLQNIEVKSSDLKLLHVIPHTKAHGSAQYKIQFLNELPFDKPLSVVITSSTTKQDIHVPILSSSALEKTCSIEGNTTTANVIMKVLSNIGLIVTGVVVLGITIWVYAFCYANQNIEINADAFNTTNNLSSRSMPCTPKSSTPISLTSPGLYPNLTPYQVNTSTRRVSPTSPVRSGTLSSSTNTLAYGETTIPSSRRTNAGGFF